MKARDSLSLYATVTNDILDQLEKGVAPWVKPWSVGSSASPCMPRNAMTQKRYRGMNVLILWGAAIRNGYHSPFWIGYRQAQEMGGYIKKEEKSTAIVYGATFVPKGERGKPEEEQQHVPFLNRRNVFNVEQTADLPESVYQIPEAMPLPDAIARVDGFLRALGSRVRHGGDRACFMPSLDFIVPPLQETFESTAHYYATSLHEHTHWTGHKSRLDRDLAGKFGTASYAAEELVAELGAAYLCATLGIPGYLRHAEYIGSWVSLLRDSQRAIFTAASRATQAAEYLSKKGGVASEEEEGTEDEEETP